MDKISSALLLLVAIPACSDSSTALADLPAAVTDALCTYAARCGQMPDVASCKAVSQADMGQISADVASGKTKYDGKAAATCLDAYRSQSCNYSDTFNQSEPQACKDAFKGTVADGGVCHSGQECVSGECSGTACSGISTSCCPGVCMASASSTGAIPIGGDCSGIGAVCVSGAFCKYGLTTTCQAKAAVGQSCDTSYSSSSCVAGAFCVASGSSTGTCSRLPAEGQTCVSTGVSYLPACDSMLDYCDSVTLKCVPKIAVGGNCSAGAPCVAYAACDATGHCVSKGRAGEACDDVNGPGCLGSLLCNSGICAMEPATAVCP